MATTRDQLGNDVLSKGTGLPTYGSTVTLPDGTGRIGNAIWLGGLTIPKPPPK